MLLEESHVEHRLAHERSYHISGPVSTWMVDHLRASTPANWVISALYFCGIAKSSAGFAGEKVGMSPLQCRVTRSMITYGM